MGPQRSLQDNNRTGYLTYGKKILMSCAGFKRISRQPIGQIRDLGGVSGVLLSEYNALRLLIAIISCTILSKGEIIMAKTSNIFARVEPEIKEQAEKIFNQLGIPMSNAISIFLRQVVYQKGIPFDIKLPQTQPPAYESLTPEQFNAEIEKGLADFYSGDFVKAEKVAEKMRQDYGV